MATSFGNSSIGPRAKKTVASSRAPEAPTCGEEARARGPHSFATKTPRHGPELRKPRASACCEDGPRASSFGPRERRSAKFCPRSAAFGGCTSFGNLGFDPREKTMASSRAPQAPARGEEARARQATASDEWRKYQFSRPPTRGLRSMLFGFDIHVYGLHQRKFSASASILQITKPAYWASG